MLHTLKNLAQEKINLNIEEAIKLAWKEFKEDAPNYIGYTLISLVLSMLTGFLPRIGLFAGLIIGLPLQMGNSGYYHKKINENSTEFNNFFSAFNKTGPLLIYNLIIIGCGILLIIPIAIIAAIYNITPEAMPTNPGFIIISIIFIAAFLLVAVCINFAPYFITFFNATPIEAIKLSINFVKPRIGQFIIFYLLATLIAIAGALCLVVGLIIAIPIIRLAYYNIFANITKLNSITI